MFALRRPFARFSAGLAASASLAAVVLTTSPAAAAGQTPVSPGCSSVTDGVSVVVASPGGGSLQPACVTQQGNILVIVLSGVAGQNQSPSTTLGVTPGVTGTVTGGVTGTGNVTSGVMPSGTVTPRVTPGVTPTPVSFLQVGAAGTGPSQAVEGNMSAVVDPRVDTYAKRQAIRDQYRGKIDEVTFNDELGDGVSPDTALADALAAFRHGHA